MKYLRPFIFSLLVAASAFSYSQDEIFNVTIQGNWDRTKDAARAQFAGDNNRIYAYFANFVSDIKESGEEVSRMGQIEFTLSAEGTVKNLIIIKGAGQRYDDTIAGILKSTTGKWRPAEVDGKRKSENLTVWYSIYKGPKKKSTFQELLSEIDLAVQGAEYRKALKLIDKAEYYDQIHPDLLRNKLAALRGLGKKNEACDVLYNIKTFGISLEDGVSRTCN